MTRLWRTYIALWAGSFGEMPSVATFRARILLLLWHTAALIALIGLLSLFGCSSDAEVEHDVRANLCKKRGPFWIYVTESDIGYRHYHDFRCMHYDSVATRDSVLWP